MPAPQDMLQQLRQARSDAEAAIIECNEKWEVKPTGGEGEDAWSPKEVAQHIVGAEWFFTNLIGQACGAPSMERPQFDVTTPQQAAAALRQVGEGNDTVLNKLTEGDLAKTTETRFGTQSVQQLLEMMTNHARDHVNQLRAANA